MAAWDGAGGGEERRQGEDPLGDEATMKLVQLLLGQHQVVSLSKTNCAQEGHLAHVDGVALMLLLGPEEVLHLKS